MSNALDLYVRLAVDNARLNAGFGAAARKTRDFVDQLKSNLSQAKDAFGSLHGQLATLGVGLSMAVVLQETSQLDKSMKLLKNTTGATNSELAGMRKEMYANQQATGVLVDEQKRAADALAAGGMSIDRIRATLTPMSEVMAVAKTDADQLAKALSVTGTHFGFDLTNAKVVTSVLDKMYQAGNAGFAELENLPDIFARVGTNAKAANLSFEETLATIETLSKFEAQPERLGTLVDSTLRVFTNAKYMKDASKATGVRFFDSKGMRRNALDVLDDIEARFRKLQTDAQRSQFVSKAFGQSDQTTVTGLVNLLKSGSLQELRRILGSINNASGAVKRDLEDSLKNSVDAASRLKGALKEAADGFTKPIRDTFTNVVGFVMDDQEKGGLGLTSQEMVIGGTTIAGLMAALPIARILAGGKAGSAVGGAASSIAGFGANLAVGKVLQDTAGVASVFVVNMPSGGMGGSAGGLPGGAVETATAAQGGLSLATITSIVAATAPLAVMYAATEMAGDTSKDNERAAAFKENSDGLASFLKWFGFDKEGDIEAQRRKNREELGGETVTTALINQVKQTEIKGQIAVQVTAAPGVQATVTSTPGNRNTALPVGKTMAGVG